MGIEKALGSVTMQVNRGAFPEWRPFGIPRAKYGPIIGNRPWRENKSLRLEFGFKKALSARRPLLSTISHRHNTTKSFFAFQLFD